jgi:hypothetical protein
LTNETTWYKFQNDSVKIQEIGKVAPKKYEVEENQILFADSLTPALFVAV